MSNKTDEEEVASRDEVGAGDERAAEEASEPASESALDEPSGEESEVVGEEESGGRGEVASVAAPAGRFSRLATGAISAMTSAGAATDPRGQGVVAVLRRFMVPIGVFCFLAILFLLFREILLPFIFALVIVYLMEPLISRIGYTPEDPTGIPRWLAVILVYLVFFGVVTATVVGFVPRFVAEIVSFGETVPEEVQNFRTVQLPKLNKQLKNAVSEYAPLIAPKDGAPSGGSLKEEGASEGEVFDVGGAISASSALVREARRGATSRTRAHGEARRLVNLASEVQVTWELMGEPGFQERAIRARYDERTLAELARRTPARDAGGYWTFSNAHEEPTFRLVPVRGGGFDFFMSESADIEIEQTDDDRWTVRKLSTPLLVEGEKGGGGEEKEPEDESLQSVLDLERGLDELIGGLIKTSNKRLSSVITFAQQLVVGIIQAFVALILTLMVAAFITIDLHGVMGFFRSIIPKEHRGSYDVLLEELDRGLGGVVRGQLMICLVNGVLTYIGLVILDIKFSLLLAVVAGVLSLIPIFGTILSSIPIVLFGLTSGLMTGVFALLWILGIHFVEANILNPKIIGTSAHIHPVIVIFALLAGESAFGLVGALLAVPTASILLTLFKFFVMRSEQGREAFEEMTSETDRAPA